MSTTLGPLSPRTEQDGSSPPAGRFHAPPARRRRRAHLTAWLAIAPAGLAVLIVIGYPVFDGIRLSFTDWSGVGKPHWIGLANYRSAAHEPQVRHSIILTLEYASACAAGMVAVGTILAAAVSGKVKGASFYRVVWFLPGVAPLTVVAIFWAAALQPQSGAVNGFLDLLDLGKSHAWLARPDTAIYAVILVTIWSGAGFAFLLLLGAVEQIPISLYEAASVDGATRARQFFTLTLPLIRPVLVTCAMLELIWTANGFSVVWAMTQGGPGDSTQTLPILVYRQAFGLANYGLASAMAAISGVILMVIGLISLRLSRSRQTAALS